MRAKTGIRAFAASIASAVVAVGCGGEDKPPKPIPLASVKTASERVEKVRGLEFRRPPRVRTLDRRGMDYAFRRVISDELLRQEKAGRLEALEKDVAAGSLLALLTGAIEPNSDLTEARTARPSLHGAYEAARNTVYLRRRSVQGGGRAGNEVLAHELTHALEAQALGSGRSLVEPLAESTGGRQALIEGSATLAQIMYARRHLGVRSSVEDVLDERERDAKQQGLPRVIAASQSFPYVAGGRFAHALYRRAGGSWRLVDRAHRRPPVSTEQVLHPDKWLAGERPVRVSIPRRPPLERGLRRVGDGELGELDTGLVLGTGVSEQEASRAASGWGGGAFAVWQYGRGPDPVCPPPCRQRFAALMAWRWDSERDAREALRTSESYVEKALKPRSGGNGAWRLEEGAVAIAGSGRASSLAFASTVKAARALAAAGVG